MVIFERVFGVWINVKKLYYSLYLFFIFFIQTKQLLIIIVICMAVYDYISYCTTYSWKKNSVFFFGSMNESVAFKNVLWFSCIVLIFMISYSCFGNSENGRNQNESNQFDLYEKSTSESKKKIQSQSL